jgi:hypothetical protein
MKEEDMLIEVIQRLCRMEERLKEIQKHTDTMNNELGMCMERIRALEIKSAYRKRLSWKDIGIVISGSSGIATLAYTLLRIFVFKG